MDNGNISTEFHRQIHFGRLSLGSTLQVQLWLEKSQRQMKVLRGLIQAGEF